jgi:YVTN family beta-propeller protein
MMRATTIARLKPFRLVAGLSLIALHVWRARRRFGLCALLAMIVGTPLSVEARPFAYVANINSHDVSVIDLATDAVIATIPLGAAANEVAITPDGIRAYVTTGSAGLVKVIDTDPTSPTYNTVITTVTIGGFPQAVVISPDGALAYVTDFARASVSAIDTSSNAVIAIIPVGHGPNGVVFSPDGTLAYVVNFSADLTLSVIDTASSTVINTITFPRPCSTRRASPW